MFILTKKTSESKDFLFRASEASLTACCQCYGQSTGKTSAQKAQDMLITWCFYTHRRSPTGHEAFWFCTRKFYRSHRMNTQHAQPVCCAQLNQARSTLGAVIVRLMPLKNTTKVLHSCYLQAAQSEVCLTFYPYVCWACSTCYLHATRGGKTAGAYTGKEASEEQNWGGVWCNNVTTFNYPYSDHKNDFSYRITFFSLIHLTVIQ